MRSASGRTRPRWWEVVLYQSASPSRSAFTRGSLPARTKGRRDSDDRPHRPPQLTSAVLDFIRKIVDGDVDGVSRRLARDPTLATQASGVGATRQQSSAFFFPDIGHYLYAGDTALHMAAAAFQ